MHTTMISNNFNDETQLPSVLQLDVLNQWTERFMNS